MPKIGFIGQVPKDWSESASQKTLFQPWPDAPGTDVGQLEPYGNPAYEGYGYPAAGYGQTRRKVVGLAQPKGVNPQLVGWEDPQPRGLKITPRGSLNENSDRFSRGEIAVLQGLGGLGVIPAALPLLNLVSASQIAGWIGKGFPADYVEQLSAKIIKDDAAVVAAWQATEAMKKAGKPPSAQLVADQQKAFTEVNKVKFWVLLFPDFQKSLGFTSGKPKVVPPNYDYIKSNPDSSLGFQVFDWARQGIIGGAVKPLIEKGYITGSLNGLGNPLVVAAVALAVATPLSIFLYFYGKSSTGDDLRLKTRKELVEKESRGEVPKGTVAAFDGAVEAGDKAAGKAYDAITYAAIGVSVLAGVGLTIYLINKFRG